MNTCIELVFVVISTVIFFKARDSLADNVAGKAVPKPCCFPSAFQATVADLRSAGSGEMRLFEVYRDWDRRMQVQRIMTFASPGQVAPVTTVILDFKNGVEYVVTASGDCHPQPLSYGMLEPCIPDDAKYLGQTYLGFGEDKTQFRTWSFRRGDQGRNVSMTVSVTLHDCVPVMETISGTLGYAPTDSLITFTTFKVLQDSSIFEIPRSCASLM
ncbi:hypothetical protein V1264_012349 [Littorina saxatilis]|uniref:Uncharacterized protein n=1 Tax=Littorina saxatilis TaxID=31220 RepID=A0AAN9BX99_9CAEN